MDNCFRFLVNIDKCFNMSVYDMFFYKLQYDEKIKINHVQSAAKNGENSLGQAVSDIRMYLNKYPYNVKEYQFVFVMRRAWEQEEIWENTLLYRLVGINRELRKEHICMDVSGRTDRALNLIMLYETDLVQHKKAISNYFSSTQLKEDIELLFKSINLDCSETCLDAIEKALAIYADSMKETTKYLLKSFVDQQKYIYEHMEEDSSCKENIIAAFSDFLGRLLSNYQVFEIFVHKGLQHPKENTEALLRIVEYINSSFEYVNSDGVKEPLSNRCVKIWDKAINNNDIERKYAEMLSEFQGKLNRLQLTLDTSEAPVPAETTLPEIPEEKEEEIVDEDGIFSFGGFVADEEKKKAENNKLKSILDVFLAESLSVSKVNSGWQKAYRELFEATGDLESSLQDFARRLSNSYSRKVEQRRREALKWEKGNYFATKEDKEKKFTIKKNREKYLEELKEPHMRPSLRFEDQNNFRNCLENKNAEIRKYTKCLSLISLGNFMLLLLFIIACIAVHYVALQPFVFNSVQSAVVFASVLAVVFIFSCLFWIVPRRYFIKKIKKSVQDIEAAINIYMRSYHQISKNFYRYINVLNLLDCYNVYYNLYNLADERSGELSRIHLWHKLVVKDMLVKVSSFNGLIEHCGHCRTDDFQESNLAGLFSFDDTVKDIYDFPEYWVQG